MVKPNFRVQELIQSSQGTKPLASITPEGVMLHRFLLNQSHQNKLHLGSLYSVMPDNVQDTIHLIWNCLAHEHVGYVFGSMSDNPALMHYLSEQSPISYIPTHREQSAIAMAAIYSRLTRHVGVCLALSDASSIGLVSGVIDATLNHAPLLVITGQFDADESQTLCDRQLDIKRLFEPVVKWYARVTHLESLPETLHSACAIAQAGIPGVVHIHLTLPLLSSSVPSLPQWQSPTNTYLSDHQLDEVAQFITQFHNPILLVGNGAVREPVHPLLLDIATQLGALVATTRLAKGVIPETHELSLGTLTCTMQDYYTHGFDWADSVITIGYNLQELSPLYWNPDGDLPVIHIGRNAAEICSRYQPSRELVGNLSFILDGLRRRLYRRQKPTTLQSKLKLDEHAWADGVSYHQFSLIQMLQDVVHPEDILVSDAGSYTDELARYYRCINPNTCLMPQTSSVKGVAIPGAIAAKLIYPEKRAIAITEEDGFLASVQELEIAKYLGTPFVTLIINQERGRVDFIKLADSLRLNGYRVTSAAALKVVLEEALTQSMPTIIDCAVNNSPLTPNISHRQKQLSVCDKASVYRTQ
ncbi:MAG: thiamine pyrophosphate-binding protein [Elainellaceae cyanobacterium]